MQSNSRGWKKPKVSIPAARSTGSATACAVMRGIQELEAACISLLLGVTSSQGQLCGVEEEALLKSRHAASRGACGGAAGFTSKLIEKFHCGLNE